MLFLPKKHSGRAVGALAQVIGALAIAALLFLSDFAFFTMKYADRFPRPWSGFYETFGVLLLLSFGLSRKWFLISLIGIHLMALLQMMTVAYFGVLVTPTMMWLSFTQQHEIWDTLPTVGHRLWLPALLVGLSFLGTLWVRKASMRFRLVKVPYLNVLLAVALAYGPVRAFVTGDQYGKQPSIYNMAFANLWATSGYFLGQTLPRKIKGNKRGASADASPPALARKTPGNNVIIVMGESLRWKNMSLFGYPRETTPLLAALWKEGGLVARKAISGGVSTDVSLPLFFNATLGLDSFTVVTSQNKCLFKLAKNNGYETHFHSTQSGRSLHQIMNYICPDSIDQMSVGVNPADNSEGNQLDEELLPSLRKLDFSKPQFVVLHQRGSHSPYESRFPPSFAKFKTESGDSYEDAAVKNYDNSVYYTDHILAEIIGHVRAHSIHKTYVIFTSDHGQLLGEGQQWGHGMLSPEVPEVPFLFHSNDDDMVRKLQAWPDLVTHWNISNLILHLIGYQAEFPPQPAREVLVMGSDPDDLEGVMTLPLPQNNAAASTQQQGVLPKPGGG